MSGMGPESRALFKSARKDFEPSDGDRARTHRAVARRLGIAAGTLVSAATSASAGVAPAAAASTMLGVAKWIAVGVLVSAAGAGGVSMVRSSNRAPRDSHAPGAAVATPAPRPSPSDLTPSANRPTPEPELAPTPAARPAAPHELASPSPPAARPSPSPASPVSPVAEETRLVRGADEALRAGDAARALALLEEHARAFPHGILAEERSAERVSALCALGRIDDARAETARFLLATPDSPLATSVRASCGGDDPRAGDHHFRDGTPGDRER